MAGFLDGVPQEQIDDLPSLGELRASPDWQRLSADQQRAVSEGWRKHVVPAQSWYKNKAASPDVKNARASAIMNHGAATYAPDAPTAGTAVSKDPLANFAAGAYNNSLMGQVSQAANGGVPVFGAAPPQSYPAQLAQQAASMALDTPAYIAAGGTVPAAAVMKAGPILGPMVSGAAAMGIPAAARTMLQSGDPAAAGEEALKQGGVGALTMGIGAKVGGLDRFAGNTMAKGAQRLLASTGAEAATMTGANTYLNGVPVDANGNTDYGAIGKDLASNLVLTGAMKAATHHKASHDSLNAAMAEDAAQAPEEAPYSEPDAAPFHVRDVGFGKITPSERADAEALMARSRNRGRTEYDANLMAQQDPEAQQAREQFAAGQGRIVNPTAEQRAPGGLVLPGQPRPDAQIAVARGGLGDVAGTSRAPRPGSVSEQEAYARQQLAGVEPYQPARDPSLTPQQVSEAARAFDERTSAEANTLPTQEQIAAAGRTGKFSLGDEVVPRTFDADPMRVSGTEKDGRLILRDQSGNIRRMTEAQLQAMADRGAVMLNRIGPRLELPQHPPANIDPNNLPAELPAMGPSRREPSTSSGDDHSATRPMAAITDKGVWHQLLGDERGQSNFTGVLGDLADRWHREEQTVDPDLLRRYTPTGQRNGHDVYTIRGQEWEHAGTNANGREIMHRYDTPEQRAQSTGIGARVNDALQPLNNAGERARAVRHAGNTSRLGEVIAGKFIEDLVKFTPQQKARMHKVLDDPNNVGGHNITLTGEEQAMVNRAKAMMDEVGTEGVRFGVLKGKRDIYAPHLYEEFLSKIFNAAQPGTGGRLSTSTSHSKERTFEFLHEAEAAGLHPVYDIGSVADVYKGLKGKIAAADLLTDLKTSLGPNGRPLVQPADSAPRDYVEIRNPQFRGQLVHPKVAAAVKAYAENNTSGAERAYLKAKQLTISYQLAYPMIHGMNVAGKAVWKSGLGLPADIMKGHEMWANEATVRDAVEHNLNLQGNSLGPIHEILDGAYGEQRNSLLRNIDNAVTRGVVSKVMDTLHHALWSNVRALQLGTYERAWRTMVKRGQPVDEAKNAAAYLANNWMGMIPREEMSDALRRFSNVALYSRGWTLGNLKSYEVTVRGAKALPPDIAGTTSGHYVAQAMRMSVIGDTMARLASLAAANWVMSTIVLGKGQWPWQNEPGKRGRIIIGQDKDGTLRYSQLPVFKFTDDLLQSIPAETKISEGKVGAYWANKTAPGVKALGEAMFNSDSRGQDIYKDTEPFWKRFALGADHILQGNLPGYDMVRYAMRDKDTGTSKMQDDMASLASMPRQAQAAYAFSKLLGAGVSKGARGGQEAAAMMANRKLDEAQRADIITRFNKMARDEATRQQAAELLADAKDQNGDPLFKRSEMRGLVKAAAANTPDKVARYEAQHPGFAAAQTR